jgi:hypothetical protein
MTANGGWFAGGKGRQSRSVGGDDKMFETTAKGILKQVPRRAARSLGMTAKGYGNQSPWAALYKQGEKGEVMTAERRRSSGER